ncbi:MAG: hypothetical protein GXP54_13235, partial [Deltaproteobacteria bacterium]|nr:hypothetical protein [Deltaproteobacteria bacterium]
MSEIQNFLIPVIELIGVMVAAVVLVSLLVSLLVAVLRRWTVTGGFGSYKTLLAVRILVGYREEGGGFLSRLIPVSGQNFIAMVGTAIGVWALIVVLSVMGGFEADLKGKIVRFSPHVTVDAAGGVGEGVVDKAVEGPLSKAPHVTLAETMVEGEAMLTSMTNMSPGMKIIGIDPDGRLAGLWLRPVVGAETMDALKAPVRVMSDRDMGFEAKTREAKSRDSESMPPIPAAPGNTGRVLPGIVLGEELARSLSVARGALVT